MTAQHFTLGIIAGSGPEAGIDLWSKILAQTQRKMGGGFGGDLDAPRVIVVSEPRLGLSMDLRENEASTWAAMEHAVRQIAPQVDAFAVACNTLNWFSPAIENLLRQIDGAGQLVSYQQVLKEQIRSNGAGAVGLLGAAPVTALDEYSAYAALTELCMIEVPADCGALQALIYDVKRLGSTDPSLSRRLAGIIAAMRSEILLLACTELPLIAPVTEGKRLIDVTDLVAGKLAELALNARKALG